MLIRLGTTIITFKDLFFSIRLTLIFHNMKLNKFITAIIFFSTTVATSLAGTSVSGKPQMPGDDMLINAKESYEEYKRRAQESYQTYQDEAITRYLDFRDSVLLEFVKSMKQPWKKEASKPAVPKPVDNSIEPEIVTIEEGLKQLDQKRQQNSNSEPQVKPIDISEKANKQVTVKSTVVVPELEEIQPAEPFVPVITSPDDTPETFNFLFYGTMLSARIDDSCKFKIETIDNNGVAKAMAQIVSNNMLHTTLSDCIEIRDKYKLCDWAYMQMLVTLGYEFFGGATNEATLLTGYLYCMSGYKMRYGYDNNNNLRILFACDQHITDIPFISLRSDGFKNYYILNGSKEKNEMHICDYSFPQEKAMSLYVKDIPLFDNDLSNFNMKLHSYPIQLTYKINKNLIDFYESYPTPRTGNDVYSKWEYYARTPLSEEAKNAIYPILKKELAGKSELESVNILMDWIETYKYGYDSKIWGYDRAFFPDETLFYPSSDCEDHAILLTRLVSDLLGLKTAFIYYPGHLAAAVKFTEDVPGDYIMHESDKYTVCDPTIYYGKAGRTMKDVSNDEATVIVLP